MLKGVNPLLGPELLAILRSMGHGDEIAIVDANYPAAAHGKRVVRMDGHTAPLILDAVLTVLPLDRAVRESAFRPEPPREERSTESMFAEFARIIESHEHGIRLVPLVGDAFYARVQETYAVVASGERRLYGNIILRKGVIGLPMLADINGA
jgi:L-fucose mutarotase